MKRKEEDDEEEEKCGICNFFNFGYSVIFLKFSVKENDNMDFDFGIF